MDFLGVSVLRRRGKEGRKEGRTEGMNRREGRKKGRNRREGRKDRRKVRRKDRVAFMAMHQAFGDSQLTCFLLQWCRISKTMTLLLFHEVWSHIFAMLEELNHAQVVSSIQRQYFQRVAGPGDVNLWSAPWRSGPDRTMPGTDVGSAPQESWHANSLKTAFAVRKYDPFELATHLQTTIVDPQLQDLQCTMNDDTSFQHCPAIGKFIDQHILHNSCALAREGRAAPHVLLGLNQHQSFQDPAGNTWMLLPKSTLKVDWSKSGRKKAYKHRALSQLPPHAVEQFADMVRATSSLQIKEAWRNLGFCAPDGQIDWKGAAKMFDDWNVVLSGPLTRQFWRLHHSSPLQPNFADSNLHALHLCFNCAIAAKWGPCEHMYASMLHHNLINECSLPRPKAKGRPAKKARSSAPLPNVFQLTPGPGLEHPASSSASSLPKPTQAMTTLSSDQIALQTLLRKAGCGHLFPAMLAQQATIAALRACTMSDFVAIFGCNVGVAHKIMTLLANVGTSDLFQPLCFSFCFFFGRLMHFVLFARSKFQAKSQSACFCKAVASSPAAPSSPSAAEA